MDAAFHQTQAMARALGVNLTTAVASGHLKPQALAEMVARCRACGFPEMCTVWLAQSHGRDAQAPDFCANKRILDRIAKN